MELMGVGSSREVEEQLEAALSLLDAARTRQEHLKAECDNLQQRITAQSATLLKEEQSKAQGTIHVVYQGDPLSKRVLFGLALTTPLAIHTALTAVSIQVIDLHAFAQAAVLLTIIVLLLRFRRYRWRRATVVKDDAATRRRTQHPERMVTPPQALCDARERTLERAPPQPRSATE